MSNRERTLKVLCSKYKSAFDPKSSATKLVLYDLMTFCKMNQTSIPKSENGMIDPLAMAANEGRREVFLHIMERLNIDLEQLQKIIEAQEKESKQWA